ncbi:hypothetical protein L6164_032625 [Bauhinia variegata]|uniref:Uncharacterized protein n=1 Tax=Bauhinia variegata TaxID=167791 RepID=A0ACB9KP69_BAUVA|nr:hypothetical protein L6164_032625 [Bauhinia variegata]
MLKSYDEIFQGGRIALNADTVLVVRLPETQILSIMSRSQFLAMVLVAFSCLGSIFRAASLSSSHAVVSRFGTAYDPFNVELLNWLFHDLAYDFVFTSSSKDAKFIDRILVALPLDNNPLFDFKEQSNYMDVYVRRYSSIIVALRKTGPANKMEASSTKRKEAKKVALKGLEDVFLEPPRRALVDSKNYLKKIKYLPDLLGDSLEGYERRVFISIGSPEENKEATKWFQHNYPKKNHKFVIHSLQVVQSTDVSVWLSMRLKEEEYVVMKAEAEVVEEMLKKKTMHLVDELFLECKNEWWQNRKTNKGSSRAYWECLNLYGRLRDEGVAVHQWWS